MAPEVTHRGSNSKASDIFALGKTFQSLLNMNPIKYHASLQEITEEMIRPEMASRPLIRKVYNVSQIFNLIFWHVKNPN